MTYFFKGLRNRKRLVIRSIHFICQSPGTNHFYSDFLWGRFLNKERNDWLLNWNAMENNPPLHKFIYLLRSIVGWFVVTKELNWSYEDNTLRSSYPRWYSLEGWTSCLGEGEGGSALAWKLVLWPTVISSVSSACPSVCARLMSQTAELLFGKYFIWFVFFLIVRVIHSLNKVIRPFIQAVIRLFISLGHRYLTGSFNHFGASVYEIDGV